MLNFNDPNPSGSKPILLLHGLGSDSSSWRFQVDPLIAHGFRPILPDLPGFGLSSPVGWDLDGKKIRKAIEGLLRELNCNKIDLIGLSMGGVIAQQFTIDHPEMVDRLMLVSTFGKLFPDNISQFNYFFSRFGTTFLRSKDDQALRVGKKIFPKPEHEQYANGLTAQIIRSSAISYRSAMINLGTYRLGDRLKNFNNPVLIVAGDEDTTVILDRQKKLHLSIPSSNIVVIPGGGHGVAVDSPEKFNEIMLDFLN